MIHFQANTTQFAVYAAYLVYSLALEKIIYEIETKQSLPTAAICAYLFVRLLLLLLQYLHVVPQLRRIYSKQEQKKKKNREKK
jgi:fucose permease